MGRLRYASLLWGVVLAFFYVFFVLIDTSVTVVALARVLPVCHAYFPIVILFHDQSTPLRSV